MANHLLLNQGGTALYRIFDQDGRLLYVGISDGVLYRLGQHLAHSPFRHAACHAEWDLYPTRIEDARAEWQLIRRLRPPHNVVGLSADPWDVFTPKEWMALGAAVAARREDARITTRKALARMLDVALPWVTALERGELRTLTDDLASRLELALGWEEDAVVMLLRDGLIPEPVDDATAMRRAHEEHARVSPADRLA